MAGTRRSETLRHVNLGRVVWRDDRGEDRDKHKQDDDRPSEEDPWVAPEERSHAERDRYEIRGSSHA